MPMPTGAATMAALSVSTATAAVAIGRVSTVIGVPSRKPDGRLRRLEALLVDPQSLDLRFERRRRHAEPPRGAERPGHSALAVLERSLDGGLFVGRQRAGGQARDRRGPLGPTGEAPRLHPERVPITPQPPAAHDLLPLPGGARPPVRLGER